MSIAGFVRYGTVELIQLMQTRPEAGSETRNQKPHEN